MKWAGTETDGAARVAGGHRHLLADEGALAGKSSPEASDQDARYGYRSYLTPTGVAKEDLEEPSLIELARVIKARTCIEASF